MADKKKRTLGDDLRDFRAGKIGDKFYRYNPVPFMVKTDDVKDTIPISSTKSNLLNNNLVNTGKKPETISNTKKIASTMTNMLNNPKILAEKVKADTPKGEVHTVPSKEQYYQRLATVKNTTTVPSEKQFSQYQNDVNTIKQVEQYQNEQKYDETYSGYNYAQLKAELAKTDNKTDKELYSYLENKANEVATSKDLEKSLEDELKQADNEYKKAVQSRNTDIHLVEEKETKKQEIRAKYDKLIRDKKKKENYTDVVGDNPKVLTVIQKYHEAIQQDVPEQVTDTYALQNGNLQNQKYTAEDIEEIKATYESYKDKGFDMDKLYQYYLMDLEEKKNAQIIESLKDFGEEHPILGSVGTVIPNVVGSIGDAVRYVGAGIDKLAGGDGYIDPNSTAVAQAQAIRQGAKENINNPLGEYLYDIGMSMGDFLANLPISYIPIVGSAASSTLLGTSAGVSAANEVINNGGDISKAILTGVFAGGAEAFFEHCSIDKLKALQATPAKNIKRVIKNFFKQGFVELSEEALTELSNGYTDWLINADLSNWSRQYNQYIEQGYSESTAWKMTAGNFAKQVGLAAAGGFISGGTFGTGASLISYGGYKLTQKDIENLNNKEKRKQLGEEALSNEDFDLNNLIAQGKVSGNKKAVKLANSIERTIANSGKDKITATDVGNLMYLMTLDRPNNNYEVENTEKQEIINEQYTMGGAPKTEVVNTTQQTADNKNSKETTDAFGEAHPQGLSVKTRTGGTLTVMGIESSAKDFGASDNNVILVTKEGGKINADDVTPLLPHFQQLFNYAKNFDTIGAKNFIKNYESYLNSAKKSGKNASVEAYAKAYEDLYSLGKMGVTYDSVKTSGAYESAISTLGGGIAYNATVAGNNDTNATRQFEQNKVQKIRVPGENNSINSRMYVEDGSEGSVVATDEQKLLLQAVAQKVGRDVVLTNSLKDGENGMYKDGKIYIRADLNDNYMLAVALHEATHDLRVNSPLEFQALCSFVTNYLVAKGENINEQLDDIKNRWEDKIETEDDALEELVCQTVMAIATDEKAIKTVLNIKENKNILQKVASALKKIAQYTYDFMKGIGFSKHNLQAQAWLEDAKAIQTLAEKLSSALDKNRNANTTQSEQQKNNTQKGEIESNIKFSAMDSYPYDMQTVIKDYLSDVNNDILQFVKNIKNGNREFQRLSFSKVSEKQIEDTKKLLNIDITGYMNSINTSAVEHILKRHGENGQQDESMKNVNDISRMNYILTNYDDVTVLKNDKGEPKVSIEFMDKNNKPAYMLKYTKKINGTYYIVLAVPENKYKKIWVVTAYIQKNESIVTQAFDENTPKTTSETVLASPVLSTDRISQNNSSVNNQSMSDTKNNSTKSKLSVDDTIRTDTEYMKAVENDDMETAQRLVDEVAKANGYNSPMLYHGTKSFGFTEFDLSKMDDGRSIFLTDSKRIASTYSGVEGTRKISENYDFDIDNMSPKSVVSKLNLLMDKLHKGDSEYAKYQYIDTEIFDKLSDAVSKDIDYLKDIVSKKKIEYKNNGKIYSQLSQLYSKLDNRQYTNISTPIYMLLHHTDVFKNDNKNKIAEIEKNIRLFNKLELIDVSDGVILKDMLDGYSLDILYNTHAKEELEALTLQGNYSMYGNLDGVLVIDAKGAYWNNIRNWISNVRLDYNNTEVARENDEFFYLIDKRIGEAIPESWLDVNEHTKKMSKNELQSIMLNKANNILHIRTENVRTTRDIAKFAQDHGYSGVVFNNLADNGGQNTKIDNDELSNIYIFFSSSQIKSADPVTYDDDGNVIPLSERFKNTQKDFRYSVDDTIIDFNDDWFLDEDLFFEDSEEHINFEKVIKDSPADALNIIYNTASKTALTGIAQFKDVQLDDKAYISIARKVMKDYGIIKKHNPDAEEKIVDTIQKYVQLIESGNYSDGADVIEKLVLECKEYILMSGDFDKTVLQEERETILGYLSGKTLLITDYSEDFVRENYGNVAKYRRQMMGKVSVGLERNAKSMRKTMYMDDVISFVEENYPMFITDECDSVQGFQWLDNLLNNVLQPKFVNRYFDGFVDGFYENADTAAIEMAFDMTTEVISAKAKQLVISQKADKKKVRELTKARKIAIAEREAMLKAKAENYRKQFQEERAKRIKQIDDLRDKLNKQKQRSGKAYLHAKAKIEHLENQLDAKTIILNMGHKKIRTEYNERRDKTMYIERLGKMFDRLSKRLDGKANNNEYIPEKLKKPILDVLRSFYADPGTYKNGKKKNIPGYFGEWKNIVKIGDRVKELAFEYEKLRPKQQYNPLGSNNADSDTKDFTQFDLNSLGFEEDTLKILQDLSDFVAGKNIYDLTSDDLKDIYGAMLELEQTLKRAVEIIIDGQKTTIKEAATKAVSEIKLVKDKSGSDSLLGLVQMGFNQFATSSLDPVRFARRISGYHEESVFYKAMNEIHSGEKKSQWIEMQSTLPLMNVMSKYSNKEIKDFQTSDVSDFDFKDRDTGKRVKISQGMLLSIYLTNRQEDGHRHLVNENYNHYTLIPDLDLLNKNSIIADATKAKTRALRTKAHRIRLSKADLIKINEYVESNRMLSEIAGAISQVYNVYLAGEINEVSMKKHGRKIATVKNYFPLKVDPDRPNSDPYDEPINVFMDMRMRSRGFTKNRHYSTAPLVIDDVLRVFSKSVKEVSRYCGLLIPIENFDKIYNSGDGYTTVRKIIGDKFGVPATHYINKIRGDLQNNQDGDFYNFLTKLQGNYMASVLLLNGGATLKNLSAFPTANKYFGTKNVAKASVVGGKQIKEMYDTYAQYTPYLWYRQQGNSTVVGEMSREHSFYKKWTDRIDIMVKVDTLVIGKLLYAAELHVEQTTDLQRGTEEFYREVVRQWEKCIDETQPNNMVTSKPQYLRNKVIKILSFDAFRSQVQAIGNTIIDSVGEYSARSFEYKADKNTETKKAKNEALKKVAQTFIGAIESYALNSLFQLLVDALRHKLDDYKDEEGKIAFDKIASKYLDYFTENFAGVFMWGEQTYEVINTAINHERFFGLEVMSLETINDGIEKAIKGDFLGFVSLFFDCFTGLPTGTAIRDIRSIYSYIVDWTKGYGEIVTNNKGQIEPSCFNYIIVRAKQNGEIEKADHFEDMWIDYLMEKKGKTKEQATETIKDKLVTALAVSDDDVELAAQAFANSDLETYETHLNNVIGYGFDSKDVKRAVDKVISNIIVDLKDKKITEKEDVFEDLKEQGFNDKGCEYIYNEMQNSTDEESEETASVFDDTSEDKGVAYTYSDAFEALKSGDKDNYNHIKNYLIEEAGKEEKDIKSAMRSTSRTDPLWKEYIQAYEDNDGTKMREIKTMLTNIYGSWDTALEAMHRYQKRMKEKENN